MANLMKKIFSASRFRSVSLRYKLLIIFCVLGLLPLLTVGVVSYTQSSKAVNQNMIVYSGSIIKQVADNFDRWLREYEYTTLEFVNSAEIQNCLESNEDDFMLQQKYKLKFVFYTVNRPEMVDVAIYRSDDRFDSLKSSSLIYYNSLKSNIPKGSEIIGKDLYDEVIKATGKVIWKSGKVYKINESLYSNSITMCRKVAGFNSGKDLGIFVMHINSDYIKQIYNDVRLAEGGYIIVADNNGKIIVKPDNVNLDNNIGQQLLSSLSSVSGNFKEKMDGKDYFITYTSSQVTGWKIISLVPMKSINKNIYIARNITILVGFLILFGIVVFSIRVSNFIFKPIKYLTGEVKKVEEGNLDIKIETTSQDEIGDLSDGFGNMIQKIQSLILQKEEEQKKLKTAELVALQSQINPHFLYNTIDTALWHAKEIESNEIQEILLALARFYRISLSRGSNLITIADELDHVRSYLKIESIRFEGKFDVEFDVDDAILNHQIIKITLQPLVENAIKHGIRKRSGKGKIIISGRMEEDRIVIQVADNGAGMSEEQLNKIFQKVDVMYYNNGSYGVRNVNDRLTLQFGDSFGLKYRSIQGEGTWVDVVIPIL